MCITKKLAKKLALSGMSLLWFLEGDLSIGPPGRMMDARDLPRANENGEILGAEKGRLSALAPVLHLQRQSNF